MRAMTTLRSFTVTFRDGHTETVHGWTGVAAQFSSSAWSDVARVRPMSYFDVMVCTDCYYVHHYGHIGDDVASDDPRNVECVAAYLALKGDRYVSDHTDSETGDGIEEFSPATCDCCRSALGGSRYRLAVEADQ